MTRRRPRRLRGLFTSSGGRGQHGQPAGGGAGQPAGGGAGQPDPESGSTRAHVPYGIDLAAAWGWRLLVIGAAGYVIYRVLSYFSEFTVPLAVAALIAALIVPFVDALERLRVPRVLGAGIVLIGFIAIVGGMLALVGQQIATQFDELRSAVVEGIVTVQDWVARTEPLGLSDEQLRQWVNQLRDTIQPTQNGQVVNRLAEVGLTLTHVVTGLFVALFAAYFFLYEGERIWRSVVRLAPRQSRSRVDSSGSVAWTSLTGFVRGTVAVALVDAVGIALSAYILQVPLTLAIGALVFLGAFIPIVGALVSGIVAVLVALVAQGPVTALLMLLAVIGVQQLESNVLQPFLMGRFVSVHPLAIIVAIGAGIAVSGIAGALVAVPLVASVNAVVRHLADTSDGSPAAS